MAKEQFKVGDIRGEYDFHSELWQPYNPKRVTPEQQSLIESLQHLLVDKNWQAAATSGLYLLNKIDDNQRRIVCAFYSDQLKEDIPLDLDTILKPEFRNLVTNQVYSPIPHRQIDLTPICLGSHPKQPTVINEEFLTGLKSSEVVTALKCAPAKTFIWVPQTWEPKGEASNALIFDVTLLNLLPTLTHALIYNHQTMPQMQTLIRSLQERNEILLEAQRDSTGYPG
jgi:hypothetical protein